MQRLILHVLALIFLFVSCKSANEKDIVSKQDFTKVLTEIYLTDAYLNSLGVDSARKVIIPLYEKTFDKFDLDSNSFKKNLEYYASNAEVMDKVYAEVSTNLETMNQGFIKVDKARMDSLRVVDSVKNVYHQDSLNRVARYKSLYEAQKNLILHYKPDTLKLKFDEAAHNFYEQTGLTGGYNLETYILRLKGQSPISTPSTTSPINTNSVPPPTKVSGPAIKEIKEIEPIAIEDKPRVNELINRPNSKVIQNENSLPKKQLLKEPLVK